VYKEQRYIFKKMCPHAHSFELFAGCAQLIALPKGRVHPSPLLNAENVPYSPNPAAYGVLLAPALEISLESASFLPPWSLISVRKCFPKEETISV